MLVRFLKGNHIPSDIFDISLCLIPLICNNVASLPSKFKICVIGQSLCGSTMQRSKKNCYLSKTSFGGTFTDQVDITSSVKHECFPIAVEMFLVFISFVSANELKGFSKRNTFR